MAASGAVFGQQNQGQQAAGPGAQIASAPIFGRGQYFPPGKYAVRQVSTKYQPTRDPKKGQTSFWIEEFLVEEVYECLPNDGLTEQEIKANPEKAVVKGEVRSWVVNLGQPSAPGNVHGKLNEYFGREVTADEVDAACSTAQPQRGALWALECWRTRTQTKGGPFTAHKWTLIADAEGKLREAPAE